MDEIEELRKDVGLDPFETESDEIINGKPDDKEEEVKPEEKSEVKEEEKDEDKEPQEEEVGDDTLTGRTVPTEVHNELRKEKRELARQNAELAGHKNVRDTENVNRQT